MQGELQAFKVGWLKIMPQSNPYKGSFDKHNKLKDANFTVLLKY